MVCAAEWILRAGHLDVLLPCKRQELACVVTGVGGHRWHLTLLEQVALEFQNRAVAELDASDRQRATTVKSLDSGQHQIADGGEQERGVQRHWRAARCA